MNLCFFAYCDNSAPLAQRDIVNSIYCSRSHCLIHTQELPFLGICIVHSNSESFCPHLLRPQCRGSSVQNMHKIITNWGNMRYFMQKVFYKCFSYHVTFQTFQSFLQTVYRPSFLTILINFRWRWWAFGYSVRRHEFLGITGK